MDTGSCSVDVLLGTSVLLAGAMGKRAVGTGKSMPIVLASLGIINVAYHAKKIYEYRQ